METDVCSSEEITYSNEICINPNTILFYNLYKLYYNYNKSETTNSEENFQSILSMYASQKSRKIICLAWELKAFTKFELQVRTGISQQTVNNAIKQLVKLGLGKETTKIRNISDGRPPSVFAFFDASPEASVDAQKRYFQLLRKQADIDPILIEETQKQIVDYANKRGLDTMDFSFLSSVFQNISKNILKIACQKINQEKCLKIWF